MTTRLTTDRDDQVFALVECLIDARIAAQSGHPWDSNTYEHGSRMWHIWSREYNREMQRIVDQEAVAARAIDQGQINEGQEGLDKADISFEWTSGDGPSWWQRVWESIDRFMGRFLKGK